MQALQKIKDGFQKGDLSQKFRGSAIKGALVALFCAGASHFIAPEGIGPSVSALVGLAYMMFDSIEHLRNTASDGKFGYITKLSDVFKNAAKNTLYFAAVTTPFYISEALTNSEAFTNNLSEALLGKQPALMLTALTVLMGLKTLVDHNRASKVIKAEQEQSKPSNKPGPF